MTTDTRRKQTPQRRGSEARQTPSEVGRLLGMRGTLKGLPYGPGASQEEALKAFRQMRKEAA